MGPIGQNKAPKGPKDSIYAQRGFKFVYCLKKTICASSAKPNTLWDRAYCKINKSWKVGVKHFILPEGGLLCLKG